MCQNIEGEKDMRNEEYLCIIKIKEKLCISLALVLHVFSLLIPLNQLPQEKSNLRSPIYHILQHRLSLARFFAAIVNVGKKSARGRLSLTPNFAFISIVE